MLRFTYDNNSKANIVYPRIHKTSDYLENSFFDVKPIQSLMNEDFLTLRLFVYICNSAACFSFQTCVPIYGVQLRMFRIIL